MYFRGDPSSSVFSLRELSKTFRCINPRNWFLVSFLADLNLGWPTVLGACSIKGGGDDVYTAGSWTMGC